MWFYHLTQVLRPAAQLYWRLGLEGRTDEIPRSGPLILTPNHSSFLDPWFLLWAFPRPIRFLVTDDWYDRGAFWRWYFAANGCIPMRSRSLRATIGLVRQQLDAGQVVGVFPEGGISHDGRLQPFHPGVSLMAARSGAPVMPVAIRGAFESFPRTRRFPRPTRVRIHLGAPLRLDGAWGANKLDRAAAERFLRSLHEDVRRLLGHSAP